MGAMTVQEAQDHFEAEREKLLRIISVIDHREMHLEGVCLDARIDGVDGAWIDKMNCTYCGLIWPVDPAEVQELYRLMRQQSHRVSNALRSWSNVMAHHVEPGRSPVKSRQARNEFDEMASG